MKKRRRREARKQRREFGVDNAAKVRLEDCWSESLVVTRSGRPPDERQLAVVTNLRPMSDTLVSLMGPHLHWPPAPDELEELEEWLELGAAVWNATVRAKSAAELREGLERVVRDWKVEGEDPLALVTEIAVRKVRQFATDKWLVAKVWVEAVGGRAEVRAMSLGIH